jgi:hypothetical protein
MIRKSLEKSRYPIAIALVITSPIWFLGLKGKTGRGAGGDA